MKQLQAFDALKSDITVFVQPALTVKVDDRSSCENALLSAKTIKEFQRRIEDKRTELVRPLNDEVKMINAYAKEIMDPLGKAEAHLKDQLIKWEKQLEMQRQAELARLEEERKKHEAERLAKIAAETEKALEITDIFGLEENEIQQVSTAVAEIERETFEKKIDFNRKTAAINSEKVSGVKKVWVFEVTMLSKIPKKYFELDEKKIREAIASGTREIPGLRIFQETSIAIRR